MVTPADKIAPNARHYNDTIQLIVTRACDLRCSNCTQLVSVRRDEPKHMSPKVFREALRSLKGWPGIRGLFGGNPCISPHFPELCEILMEEVPDQRQRGLWSNRLLGHGAVVRQTFYPNARWNLNVHGSNKAADEIRHWLPGVEILGETNASWHSPILMSWKDMGLSEEAWIAKRENCDVNQRWSAGIAERDGQPMAYFCEIAAALDAIRGENHGILAEPGWWKRPIADFDAQIKGCCDRGCGVPLKFKGHLDHDETYDMSASMIQITSKIKGGPAMIVHAIAPETTGIATDYQRRFSQ